MAGKIILRRKTPFRVDAVPRSCQASQRIEVKTGAWKSDCGEKIGKKLSLQSSGQQTRCVLRKFDRRAGDNPVSAPQSHATFGFIYRPCFPSDSFQAFPDQLQERPVEWNETTWMQGFTVGRHNGSMMVA